MNFALISQIIGYPCHSLTDDGNVAIISTPFTFEDGDRVPAYVELGSGVVRFFDDGDVFFHFLGRGIPVDAEGGAEFLSAIAEANGVSYSGAGDIEIQTVQEHCSSAFAKYMAAMLALISWEKAWEAEFYDEIPVSAVK